MKIGYREIIKKSFSVAKKAKWLWVYGILLAASGSSFNSSRQISSQDLQNIPTSLTQTFGSLEKVFTTWTSQLTPGQIFAFFGSLTLFGIFSIIIAFVLEAWAEGSMIYGAEEALEDKQVNLVNTSPRGLKYFKGIIALRLIAIGMGIVLVLAIAIPTAILIGISVAVKLPVLSAVIGIVAAIAFIILAIALTGARIYGSRLIVLKNYAAWNAWKDGLKKGKKYPLKLVVAGIISGVITGIISTIAIIVSLFVLGLPVFLLVSPLFTGAESFSLAPIVPSILLLFVFIWFNAGVTGAMMTFKNAFWNQFFNKIWNEK